ncbi:MAG: replication-associated recombination protein A, partial [Gammaproteobacteria bacterium]
IGATTENPFFAINAPLVSRSQIFQLDPLGRDHILVLLRRALAGEDLAAEAGGAAE